MWGALVALPAWSWLAVASSVVIVAVSAWLADADRREQVVHYTRRGGAM